MMENIKIYEQVIYWHKGIMSRGRILDIKLDSEGTIFYIENLKTHEVTTERAEQVTKE